MDIKPTVPSRTSSYISWVGVRTQSTLKRSPSNVKTFWIESHRQARADFRARWGRGCLGVLAFLWFVCLTVGFSMLCYFATSSTVADHSSACLPDDSFSLDPREYRYWSRSGFFQITLGFGRLSFTQAKAIDVIWDIVIGRGGQGLLALISWQVFVNYVTTSMEVAPVTFNTYRVVFLQNVSLILAIPRIIRDFVRRRGLHSKFAMYFMVFTILFTLVFPSLGSAMTGYSGNVMPYVPDPDGNFIPFNNFSIVLYTVHDGDRIGQMKEYHNTVFKEPNSDDPILTDVINWSSRYYRRIRSGVPIDCTTLGYEYERSNCASEVLTLNISSYVGQYGVDPDLNASSTFGDISLDPPTLNITAYFMLTNLLNQTRSNPESSSQASNSKQAVFLSSNQLYSQDVISRDGQCQAQKTYQWGFSFVQLNIMVLLLWLWTVGIAIMWTSAKLTMKQRGREHVAGEYKAVFELSEAMQHQILSHESEQGKDMHCITESTLRRRITKDLCGGAISYDSPLLSEGADGTTRNGWKLKAWLKREAWWLAALVVCVIIDVLAIQAFASPMQRSDLFVFFGLPLALGFAMYVGTTHRSRGMVFLWAALVVCVVPAIVLGVVFQTLSRA